MNYSSYIKKIKRGEVGVIPTDTIYGLVCSALNKEAIDRIYTIKKRDMKKPLVFLISDLSDLNILGISVTSKEKEIISKYWPGPISIIFEDKNIPDYLHRGMNGVAVRCPDNKELQQFISQVGPIATTSVNPEGWEPAKTIVEARKYFSNLVDFYMDSGEILGKPSKIIKISKEEVQVLRD